MRYRTCLLLLMMMTVAPGCEGIDHVLTSLTPTGTPTQTAEPRQYPAELPASEAYDVEVVRVNRKQVRLDNRTSRSLDGAQLWLNAEFGGAVESLPIGEGANLPLTMFVNHFGERYPVGSFLEPEKTRGIVAAELIIDNKRHPLTVRLAEDWAIQP